MLLILLNYYLFEVSMQSLKWLKSLHEQLQVRIFSNKWKNNSLVQPKWTLLGCVIIEIDKNMLWEYCDNNTINCIQPN